MTRYDITSDIRAQPLYLVLPPWLDHLLLDEARAHGRTRHDEALAIITAHYNQRPTTKTTIDLPADVDLANLARALTDAGLTVRVADRRGEA